MKFRTIAAATLGLFLCSPAIHAVADDQNPPSPMDHQGPGHEGWDEGKMKAKLDLSDDQVAKLKALRESGKQAFKSLMEKDRGLMAKLNDQVVNKAPDADIQTTLTDIKTNHTVMREQMEKMQEQKDAILTPMQQAKMMLGRRKMMAHEHRKHGDAPHP